MTTLGPMLHLKNGNLPRGVRKVESLLGPDDLYKLTDTIPAYTKRSVLISLKNSVTLYKELRAVLFDKKITLQRDTEEKVMVYFEEIENESA